MKSNCLLGVTLCLFALGTLAQNARAQSSSLLKLRSGMTSNEALQLMAGQYELGDTVQSLDGRLIIRLVPVRVGSLDGLLVLQLDSMSRMTSITWSRNARGSYARSEALDRYEGWDSWTVPSVEEFRQLQASLESDLGMGAEMVLALVERDGAAGTPTPMVRWKLGADHFELWLRDEIVEWRNNRLGGYP